MADPILVDSLACFLGLLEAVAICGAALGLILVPLTLIVSEQAKPRPSR